MRIVACFICAFLLFSGYSTQLFAAGKRVQAAKDASSGKQKTTFNLSLTPTVGEYLFDGKENLKAGQIYALKLGYDIKGSAIFDSLGIEAVAGYIDTASTVDNSKAKVYHFRVDAAYPFILKNSAFTPFVAVGGGANLYERSNSTEGRGLFGYGGGLKYKVLDYLDVRADLRHIILFTPDRLSNVEITAGLTYTFGVEKKPKPPVDSDKDGVPDPLDKCPDTPKGIRVDKDGCPRDSDRDKDGIPDYFDKCPKTPKGAKVDKNGCSEAQATAPETAPKSGTGGEGPSPDVPESRPAPAGKAQSEKQKQQSEEPGKAPLESPAAVPAAGGVAVTEVAGAEEGVEIRTSAPVETFRYFREAKPDRLVIDLPAASNDTGKQTVPLDIPGIGSARIETYPGKVRIVLDTDRESFPQFRLEKTDSGLRVSFAEAAEKVVETAPAARKAKKGETADLLRFNVEFDTAKSVIRPRYYGLLRKAARLLKANPGTVAEIKGHTDSVGKAHYNYLLSQRRAGSIRRYLVKKSGIDASRVIMKGYGYHQPVAENRTAEGRRKNRRTEVTITIRKKGELPAGGTEGGSPPAQGGN